MEKRNEPRNKKYRLTITDRQAWILRQALEVMARLGIGQFRDALELLPLKDRIHDKTWHDDMDTIGRILAFHNKESVDGWNCSLGIGNGQTSAEAKIAWDLYQVVSQRVAWERAIADGIVESHASQRPWKEMRGCQYDDPMRYGPEPLATIETVGEKPKKVNKRVDGKG